MKTAVIFFSRTGKTAQLADRLFSVLPVDSKELIQINTLQEWEKKKWFDWSNKRKIKLIATQTDLSSFDLVFFGSPVEGMSPKRKLPEEIEVYLKECRGIEGKATAVFLNCFGMPGTVLQKMQSILQTRNAQLVNSRVFTYLLNLTEPQFREAEQFARETTEKISSANLT
jgi:hypothetical protein